MADDISKKITIEVELEAENLTQNITSLNKSIDSLLAKQQQLNSTGKQNSEAFDTISTKLETLQKKLQDATSQVTANAAALNALSASSKTAETSLSSLTTQQQNNAKAVGDSAAKVKELNAQTTLLGASNKATDSSLSSLSTRHQNNSKAAGENATKVKELSTQLTSLGKSMKQQNGGANESKNALDSFSGSLGKGSTELQQLQGNVNTSTTLLGQQAITVTTNKTAFDAHKVTMDHLKTSFNEIKDVSGIFGPSLQDAAKGFNLMKTGLGFVKDGLTGVGEAIKADGFGFLLQILQQIFDYFTKTTTGSNMLKGAISAIGVVVNEVSSFFHSLMDGIISAFSHPIETLKSLGKMIEENIINRFKAFSIILDGIIHLDFKKMADGAIQAFTGVTHATDKIVTAISNVQKGVKQTVGQMEKAYKDGYGKAAKHVTNFENKVKESNKRMIKSNDELKQALKENATLKQALQDKAGTEDVSDKPGNKCECDNDPLIGKPGGLSPDPAGKSTDGNEVVKNFQLKQTQDTEDKKVNIKKIALQKAEDYAKKSAGKIGAYAVNMLTTSIKKQADAKVAALEKDKARELSNVNLTSAQRLAIEQKYKQQEGKIKAKAFKEQQEISIAQALINGAIAITKDGADLGPIGGAIAVAATIATTAVQVATIAKQKPPAMAKGGYFKSDGRGSVLSGYSRQDDTNAFLRSGEAIVVSEAMRVPWARNLVSAINVGFGGKDFSMPATGRGYAVGGIFTDGGDANRYYSQPVTDQKNLANTIAYQMINNFPPVYVDVKDVNNQQNILAQTINRVNL